MKMQDSQNILEEGTTCPICFKTFKDPRVLPCGETACNECIQVLAKSSVLDKFPCSMCPQLHLNTDFMVNRAILKMIEAKNGNVYDKKSVEILKEKLAEIKQKSEQFRMRQRGPGSLSSTSKPSAFRN
jgi:tripartite motif-containing protein 56